VGLDEPTNLFTFEPDTHQRRPWYTSGVVRALETICIVVLGLTGCYAPPQPACGFYCGAGGICPEDYTCTADNRCRLIGAADSCAPDAGIVGPDTGGFDGFPDADNIPPELTFMSPADLQSNVPVNTTIIVAFSEPVNNVSSLTFSAVANGSVVTGQLSAIGSPVDYRSFELAPFAPLPADTIVVVTLTNQIYDSAGNALATQTAGQIQFSFTTAP
jgi:hypothetical protein